MSIDLVGFLLVKRRKFYTLKEDPDIYVYIYICIICIYTYIYLYNDFLNTSQ